MGKRRGTIELIARGFVMDRAGRVLLCKNVKGDYFYLPGGHVEFGEHAAVALAREFSEETGETPDVGDLLLCHEQVFRDRGGRRHELNLVFRAKFRRTRAGRIRSREKGIEFAWIDPDLLDGVDVRPFSMHGHVKSWCRQPIRFAAWDST